jgi:Fur family peroxide stress response transcriptional regulator
MKKVLKKYGGRGFKMTPQRIAILEYLEGNHGHPSAEDIYREVMKKHPTVSFATVYNTLEALKKRREIVEITIDPERKHYESNISPHHHIVCIICKEISDVFADYSESLRLPEEVQEEFIATGNHVEFYGVCKQCRR